MRDITFPSSAELREHATQVKPQYAHTAADALQCQIDAISTVETLRKAGLYRSDPGWMHDERNGLDDLRQFTMAPLYFWTTRVADVVEQASRSYPLQEDALLPKLSRAFCVFERPPLWMVIDGVRAGLSALSWASGTDATSGFLKLRIRGLVWNGGRCTVCFSVEIRNPLELPDSGADPTFKEEVRAVYRWICSGSMFVEQRLVENETAAVGRHVARRASKLHIPSTCNVVQMRRLDRRRSDGTAQNHDAALEWQCQWLVRGHWRQQFYPSAGRHVPRWIAPYIKGPHDKPMKSPQPTVFVVKR
jgi:hypothetical protein